MLPLLGLLGGGGGAGGLLGLLGGGGGGGGGGAGGLLSSIGSLTKDISSVAVGQHISQSPDLKAQLTQERYFAGIRPSQEKRMATLVAKQLRGGADISQLMSAMSFAPPNLQEEAGYAMTLGLLRSKPAVFQRAIRGMYATAPAVSNWYGGGRSSQRRFPVPRYWGGGR